MKKSNVSILLTGIVLSFLIGFCCIACLVTGIDLPVSLWSVAAWCLISAILASFCCRGRLGWAIPLLFAVVIGFLWYRGTLGTGYQGFAYGLTSAYHDAYGWAVVRLGSASVGAMNRAMPVALCLLGSMVTAITAWSIAKGQSTVPVLILALPLAVMGLMTPGSSPRILWVWLLIYGLAMLLITGATRFDDEKRGNRLTFFTAIPVALAVAVLFAAIPKDAYMGQARAKAWSEVLLPDSLRESWDNLTGRDLEDLLNNDKRKVSLNTLGLREETNTPVMSVTPGYSGVMYLRSSALDTYNGISWTSSGDGSTLTWPESKRHLEGQETGETMISTRFAHAMLYLPYYTTSMSLHGTGRGIPNTKKLSYYSISCAEMPNKAYFDALYPSKTENPHMVSMELKNQCIDLPDSTQKWAQRLVGEITEGIGNDYHKALAIADYVRSSARYTLDPERMGSSEKDFVRWFLEESNTGYCVHFASSAAVLLRAAGIPARYVSGYMVVGEKGVPISVTDNDAHAWVEYWLPSFGWTVLECTPAATEESAPTVEEDSGFGGMIQIHIPGGVWWAMVIEVPVGVITQWRIRRRRQNRTLKKGDCRQKVISRWVRLTQLQELLKEPAHGELQELAEKAKFSNHPITEMDVEQMDCAIDEAKGKLRRHNIFRRLYYALILAR